MSELDTLPEQFDGLRKGIDTNDSLEELRYAYRKVIYSGAMKILRDYPEIIVGPPPSPEPQPQQQQRQHQQQQEEQQQLQQAPAPGGATSGNPGRSPASAGQPPPYRPNAVCQLVCIALGD